MPTTSTAIVRVKGPSKYGFFAEGFEKGLYFSKNFKEQDRFVAGAVLEVELYKSDAGSVYVNKIVGNVGIPVVKAVAVASVVDTERAEHNTPKKPFVPKFQKKTDDGMSKEEWAQKDQRISRQGVIQAAVIALAPVVSLEKLPSEAAKLAKEMLEFVNPKD